MPESDIPAACERMEQLRIGQQVTSVVRGRMILTFGPYAMKKFPPLITLVILAPMLTSCAPSPAKFCQHAIDLMVDGMQKELLLQKERGGEIEAMPSEEELAKFQDDCIKESEKKKEEDPSAYKKRVSCAMAAKTFEDLGKCK